MKLIDREIQEYKRDFNRDNWRELTATGIALVIVGALVIRFVPPNRFDLHHPVNHLLGIAAISIVYLPVLHFIEKTWPRPRPPEPEQSITRQQPLFTADTPTEEYLTKWIEFSSSNTAFATLTSEEEDAMNERAAKVWVDAVSFDRLEELIPTAERLLREDPTDQPLHIIDRLVLASRLRAVPTRLEIKALAARLQNPDVTEFLIDF